MTKEEYISYRTHNGFGEILYEFYKEGFNPDKHNNLLSKQEFFIGINMWGQGSIFLPSVLSYYNSKLDIVEISDKNGQIIKYL